MKVKICGCTCTCTCMCVYQSVLTGILGMWPTSPVNLSGQLHSGFPKLTKSCSHFPKILLISVDSKAGCKGNNDKNGYSIQGLVAKVKNTVANG